MECPLCGLEGAEGLPCGHKICAACKEAVGAAVCPIDSTCPGEGLLRLVMLPGTTTSRIMTEDEALEQERLRLADITQRASKTREMFGHFRTILETESASRALRGLPPCQARIDTLAAEELAVDEVFAVKNKASDSNIETLELRKSFRDKGYGDRLQPLGHSLEQHTTLPGVVWRELLLGVIHPDYQLMGTAFNVRMVEKGVYHFKLADKVVRVAEPKGVCGFHATLDNRVLVVLAMDGRITRHSMLHSAEPLHPILQSRNSPLQELPRRPGCIWAFVYSYSSGYEVFRLYQMPAFTRLNETYLIAHI